MTDTSTLLTDGSGAADFLAQGTCRFALVEQRSERNFVAARRGDRAALQRRRPGSTAIISRKARRSRSRSSAPKARNKMPAPAGIGSPEAILRGLLALAWLSLAQLVRSPSHSRRAEAARRCGAARAVARRRHRRRHHRADVCARCAGDQPDAAARHAGPVAGAHPDRFRQGRPMCCGRWLRLMVAVADARAGMRGTAAHRCCWAWARGCSSCSSRCWCRCSPANS